MADTSLQADPNYRLSVHRFPCDGARNTWDINFAGGFISRAHVKARIDRADGSSDPVSLTWVGEMTVKVIPTPPYGSTLTIYRDTPKDVPVANFSDGSVINEKNLDDNARQAVFIAAEALDRGEGAVFDISPRAVLVPPGQLAPAFNIAQFAGCLIGVDRDLQLVPMKPSTGGGSGGGYTEIGSGMIIHDGQTLSSYLDARTKELELTNAQLQDIAHTVTDQGEAVIGQALKTDKLDQALLQLTDDHAALAVVVDQLGELADQKTDGLSTVIANETSQRIAADTAMAASISLLGAKNGANNAFILNLDTVKVSPVESLAQRFTTISATVADNKALIEAETEARVSAVAAEATSRNSLATTLRGEISAAIQTEQEARSTAVEAEAAARTTLAATLRQESSDAVAGEALARRDAITSAITAEQQARASAIAAEASQRNQLAATLRSETTAAVSSEASARATAVAAEAQQRTVMGATLQDNITAQIQSEANARASADQVFASNFALLGARRADGSAFVLNENKVQLQGGVSLGSTLSGVQASVAGVSSSVTQLSQAVAGVQGRTQAYFAVEAVAGTGRAQLKVHADANGGGGVDIVGDVHIDGNLTVDGSIETTKLAPQAVTNIVIATDGSHQYIGTDGSFKSNGATITSTGGVLRIDYSVAFSKSSAYGISWCRLERVMDGATTIFPASQNNAAQAGYGGQFSGFILDQIPAGKTARYYMYYMWNSVTQSVAWNYEQILITEIKR